MDADVNSTKIAMIRRLARSGDTERAWELFARAGFAAQDGHADTLSLKGRLFKDRALKAVAAADRSALLRSAGQAYLRAAACEPATYPLINAATIALLDGDRARAADLAGQVLAMLDSGAHEAETAYWLSATRAEALLLLGRMDGARAALAEAMRLAPRAWEDHASTLRHFRLIHEMLGAPAGWLDAYRPPASLYYSGIIRIAGGEQGSAARIGDAIEALSPGFGFGALAAGADIIVAEQLLERGAELHIVLPSTVEAFRRDSVTRFGADWESRFDAVLAAAEAVDAPDALDRVSQAGIFVADEVAMGLTIRQARMLESSAAALRIGDGVRGQGSPLDSAWAALGLPIERVALDSAAPQEQAPLPAFRREAIIAMPVRHRHDALVEAGGRIESAGDHVLACFADPIAAARAALAEVARGGTSLGVAYGAFDPADRGLALRDMAIRIAAAAHPGRVPVSRSVAMALTLEAPDIACENFGYITTAQGDIAISLLSA